MTRVALVALLLGSVPAAAAAQATPQAVPVRPARVPSDPKAAEAGLREAFEGRTVAVRLDMPATERGVDLYPRENPVLDYPEYAKRLKQYGTALRSGDRVTVTKVKVKGKLVEFQLGGGGYGTAGDPSAYTSPPSTPKSKREESLEKQIKATGDRVQRRQLQQELDSLRVEREREDVRLRATAAEAAERRQEHIREIAMQSGSRFNLRFKQGVPLEALTPEAVQAALERYIDFGDDRDRLDTVPVRATDPVPAPQRGVLGLRKGLLEADVEQLLGRPTRTAERMEGRLRVVTRTYAVEQSLVEAQFVEGVLIRYTVSSR
jgi:hypothetical protein